MLRCVARSNVCVVTRWYERSPVLCGWRPSRIDPCHGSRPYGAGGAAAPMHSAVSSSETQAPAIRDRLGVIIDLWLVVAFTAVTPPAGSRVGRNHIHPKGTLL